jgi:hypothetical protein
MPDARPATIAPAAALYGAKSPSNELQGVEREPQPQARRPNWMSQLQTGPQWRTQPWGPQR